MNDTELSSVDVEESKQPRTLHDYVCQDIKDRGDWAEKQAKIFKKRLGERPAQKQYPYVGAPNFSVSIIDDNSRSKTDQEVSMLWNSLVICHALPLQAGVDPGLRQKVEEGFTSYVKHIIKARRNIEQAMDRKNCHGFAIFKQIRKYNHLLKQEIPDIEVKQLYEVAFPVDTENLQDAERLTDILRLKKRDYMKRAKKNGWLNAQETWKLAHKDAESDGSPNAGSSAGDEENKNYLDEVLELVGLTTSVGCNYILVWAIYHYAEEEDVAWYNENIPTAKDRVMAVGDKIVTHLCPDVPDKPLHKEPWREEDTINETPEQVDEQGNVIVEASVEIIRGDERQWAFEAGRFEERSPYLYDTRGVGELCMDDQIEATASKNAKFVMMEYYQNPVLVGVPKNSSNATFAPGSCIEEQNAAWLTPPAVPPQFDFSINDARSMSARRVGAGGMYNFSSELGNKKVEKTAREVSSEDANSANVSSASVDRFSEPLSVLFQLVWDDLRRMKLEFPVILPEAKDTWFIPVEAYDVSWVFIAAATEKTLNPEIQMQKQMNLAGFLTGMAQQQNVGFDATKACQGIAALYDSRLTRGWVIDPNAEGPQGQPTIYELIGQLSQDIKQLAQGGSDLQSRLEGVEKLSVETADKTSELDDQIETLADRQMKKAVA